jgi:hypothetical protein
MQYAEGEMQKAAHGVSIRLGVPANADYSTGIGSMGV